ncbi:MAG: hypothetical protein E6772_16005 [Dysgonomonas sp.]|nr:hypothetical protein [Dysgonomonas sp.]
MTNNKDILKLSRFCGEELFRIKVATWDILTSESTLPTLSLEIHADEIISQCDDTREFPVKPRWEIMCDIPGLEDSHLQKGFSIEVPEEDNEHNDNILYYYEHGVTFNQKVEILDRQDDKLLIKVSGETQDVNFYDGSKPNTKLEAELWFEKFDRNNEDHLR